MSLEIVQELEKYFDRLWPINRSILSPGFRESLNIVSEVMPTERLRFSTGSKICDWTVPQEWSVRDAYIVTPSGKRICEFWENNLHLVGYSTPFQGFLPLSDLKKHLHTLPTQPTAIPYVTSYYKDRWGFCISFEEHENLEDGDYEVVVDTRLYDGELEIGEAVLPGQTTEEIFFSTYLCHPSMANNELSGPLTMMNLYKRIAQMPSRKYTYRFVVVPETIGAIAYLSARGEMLKKNMVAGYVMTCLGDSGRFVYKQSRFNGSYGDEVATSVLNTIAGDRVTPFSPIGSDERQYSSLGFSLPVGSLMRTPYGEYPEYHTSLDNKEFIDFEHLAESVEKYFELISVFEKNALWKNLAPYGEPQLSSRGLYQDLSTGDLLEQQVQALFWVLSLSDGDTSSLDIAKRSGLPFELINHVCRKLQAAELLKEIDLFRRVKVI